MCADHRPCVVVVSDSVVITVRELVEGSTGYHIAPTPGKLERVNGITVGAEDHGGHVDDVELGLVPPRGVARNVEESSCPLRRRRLGELVQQARATSRRRSSHRPVFRRLEKRLPSRVTVAQQRADQLQRPQVGGCDHVGKGRADECGTAKIGKTTNGQPESDGGAHAAPMEMPAM